MKDLRIVLRQKEQDLERVRREIQALLTVIPLLADDHASSEESYTNFPWPLLEPSDNGMADLELYYPFIRHMRTSGR